MTSQVCGGPLEMLLCTYSRNAKGKNASLEVFADAGFDLPATPPMAFHRGRMNLLEAYLERDPSFPERRFEPSEVFPPELRIQRGEGLHVIPVFGSTLLYLAIEYDEIEIARWLIERGADVNAKAALDADGFGGHTPLFHTVVTLRRARRLEGQAAPGPRRGPQPSGNDPETTPRFGRSPEGDDA